MSAKEKQPGTMGKKLGIAITTYNRIDNLLKQIDLIERLSVSDIELVVCDDGSDDETIATLAERGVMTIGGVNRGIAWNKNRGVFYLFNYTDVDAVILMDDDVMPRIHGWDAEWFEAATLYGHVNYVPGSMAPYVIGGGLTAEDVGLSPVVGGMCMGVSREAFARVGFMDVRFGRYGHEHSDYSFRYVRAGYGGFVKTAEKGPMTYFYVIDGGVRLANLPSTGTPEEASKNNELLAKVANDPVHRMPWKDDEGRDAFLAEFEPMSSRVIPEIETVAKEFDEALYLAANPDVKNAAMRGLQHYMAFGRFEKRRLKP
ncbi:glycosyltransferase family 2 protein [Acetobacter nitrogenifigens]|nr:glycosyltransferase [Acetobacter nitrogenifigens]